MKILILCNIAKVLTTNSTNKENNFESFESISLDINNLTRSISPITIFIKLDKYLQLFIHMSNVIMK